jgi:hypothetical protein
MVVLMCYAHVQCDVKQPIKGVIMANTTNNTNTTSIADFGLNLKVLLGGTWNGALSLNKISAKKLREYEIGRAADNTNVLDIVKGEGEFIEYIVSSVSDRIDSLVASITFAESKLVQSDIDLAIATVDAIPSLKDKDRTKAIKEIKVSIWKAKRAAIASGNKAAKLALRTDVQKAVETAMEAWKIANP